MEKVIGLLEQVVVELRKVKPVAQVKSTRFAILSDGWIMDRATGLEWGPSTAKEMNYDKADTHCASVGGRLPTLKELQSIVDYTTHEPAIDKSVFEDTKCSWYWTSTPCAWNASYAWCVNFNYGRVNSITRATLSLCAPSAPASAF